MLSVIGALAYHCSVQPVRAVAADICGGLPALAHEGLAALAHEGLAVLAHGPSTLSAASAGAGEDDTAAAPAPVLPPGGLPAVASAPVEASLPAELLAGPGRLTGPVLAAAAEWDPGNGARGDDGRRAPDSGLAALVWAGFVDTVLALFDWRAAPAAQAAAGEPAASAADGHGSPASGGLQLFGLASAGLLISALATATWLGRRLSREVGELVVKAKKVSHGEAPAASTFHAREFHQIDEALTMTAGERWRSEERLDFLVQELQHRTNNLLAVVSSIARHTLVQGRPVAESRELFLGRLHALANASASLAQTNWRGASMDRVIANELGSWAGRYTAQGPEVLLPAPLAQNVALLLHELVANARKYGALSTGTGRVAIAWRTSGSSGARQLAFEWVERGGPPATPPVRRGFGCTLLGTALGGTGAPELTFDAEGFTYRMLLPLEYELPKAA